jgi:uroporphyrinogen decarboxylase
MTTRRQRIEAALAGGIADRPPVSLWRHWPGDDQTAETHADVTLAFQREFDWDFIKVTTCGTVFHLEDWGVKTQVANGPGGNREIALNPFKGPADWSALRPLVVTQGVHGEHLRCLRLIAHEVGEEIPFLFSVFSPSTIAERLVGPGELAVQARRNPRALRSMLALLTETLVAFVREGMRMGAAGIFLATATATYRTWSEAEYRDFGRKDDLAILEAAASAGAWFNILHLHGPEPMFKEASDFPVHALNWDDRVTPPTFAEARAQYPGALLGGLNQASTLLRGNPEGVQVEALDAFRQAGGKGLVLSAGCSLPAIIPKRNLQAARQAVEKMGA